MFLSLPFWGKGLPYKEAGAGVGFTRRGGSTSRWYRSKYKEPILDMLGAATILKSEGHDIQVYDAQFYKTKDFDDFFNHLKTYEKPEMALIRTSLPTLNNDIRIVEQLKRRWPDTIYAVFGPCFYSDYVVDYVKYRKTFDLIIVSEIETVIGDVYEKKSHCDAPGVYRKIGGDYIISNPTRLMSDLEKIPPLDYSLIDYPKLERFFLQTSKGCPVSCKFCPYYLSQGSKFRVKSITRAVDEVKTVVSNFGAKRILFRDPNFAFLHQRTHEFCKALLKQPIKFEWHCETDLHRLRPDDLELMSQAGCTRIAFGVESANLMGIKNKMHGKPPQVDILKEDIKACKALGIETRAMYILGIKGDSLGNILETIKLSMELKADISAFGLPNFYPGSNLFNDALKAGRIPILKPFNEEAIGYFDAISNQSEPPLIYVEGLEIEDLKLLRDLGFYTNLVRISRMASKLKKMVKKYRIKKRLKKRLSFPIDV
ncbi:MAG: radical SAM protein [Candidatus Omnitrophica bacterium]|nr:radical SAM protein [Candidatus Omnitrophota bacterium]